MDAVTRDISAARDGDGIAAIRGGLVNGLITDELTAFEIVRYLEGSKETLSSSTKLEGRDAGSV